MKDVLKVYRLSPLHTAVTADVIFPAHCVDLAIKCAHSHIAPFVDHACRCSPLVVLGTELLDQAGWVVLGPSPNYQNKTGHSLFYYISHQNMSSISFLLVSTFTALP